MIVGGSNDTRRRDINNSYRNKYQLNKVIEPIPVEEITKYYDLEVIQESGSTGVTITDRVFSSKNLLLTKLSLNLYYDSGTYGGIGLATFRLRINQKIIYSSTLFTDSTGTKTINETIYFDEQEIKSTDILDYSVNLPSVSGDSFSYTILLIGKKEKN